jgi:hypothetical protein
MKSAQLPAYNAAMVMGINGLPAGGSGVEYAAERKAQTHLLRDFFNNPFRPPALDAAWQTNTILALAHAANDNLILPEGMLEPERFAVLADALEEAGCTNEDILAHCHQQRAHVRECWVLGLLLGKE